jgi:hypothetical protein
MAKMTSRWVFAGGAISLFAIIAGCAGKPCDPIPESSEMKSFGFVLEGGLVCKDEKSVATVDYPKADVDKLTDLHKDVLGKAGWKVDSPSEGTLLATRDKATLFIVTGKKSKDRGVPFSVVRYCQDDACRKQLTELAAAMKK